MSKELKKVNGVGLSHVYSLGGQIVPVDHGMYAGNVFEGRLLDSFDLGVTTDKLDPKISESELFDSTLSVYRALTTLALRDRSFRESVAGHERSNNGSHNKHEANSVAYSLMVDGVATTPSVAVGRADTFLVSEGGVLTPKIIEINGRSPEGQAWCSQIARTVAERPDMTGTIGEVVKTVAPQAGRRIAFAVWNIDPVKGNERSFITKELDILRSQGVIDSFVIVSPDQIQSRDGKLFASDSEIDWVYRYFGPHDVAYGESRNGEIGLRGGYGTFDPQSAANTYGDLSLENSYGINTTHTANDGDSRLRIAGVMWSLMMEGLNGKPVVFPDNLSGVVGYKDLLHAAYEGEGDLRDIDKRSLLPTFRLEDLQEEVPSDVVLKKSDGSGGKDVVVGATDYEAIASILKVSVEQVKRDIGLAWQALIARLKTSNGWLVQPQVVPGNFDLGTGKKHERIPYDVDPWMVYVDGEVHHTSTLIRRKPTNPNSTNLRINVVQGGSLGVVPN